MKYLRKAVAVASIVVSVGGQLTGLLPAWANLGLGILGGVVTRLPGFLDEQVKK